MISGQFNTVFKEGIFWGRVILVTGGGTGIGRCIAHELAALGATVVIAGRRLEVLQKTADEIEAAGGTVIPLQLNIRDEEQVDAAIAQLVQQQGRLDGLVNNAGGQFVSPAALIRPKGWRSVLDTNLTGTFLVSQAAFRHAFSTHGGAIVNIVADMWNGFPGMAHTGAARAAVVNLTQTLAVEWAPAGVRVNAVAPGFILSSGLANYPEEVQEAAAAMFTSVPAARAGTESEVSSAVVFLLTPAAAFITGATLRVDGGGSLQKAPLIPTGEHDKLPPWDGFHLSTEAPLRFRLLGTKG